MQNIVNNIYNCDNMQLLKKLQDNSVDMICTDPPYALCDIDPLFLMNENVNNKSDFLGKKWYLPSVEFLKECNRVLKYGAFMVFTFTPRQDIDCVMKYRLLQADFDISFMPLQYCFTSGFPKANNFAKSIHRRFNEPMEVVKKEKQNGAKFKTTQEEIDNGGFNDPNRIEYDITKPTLESAKYINGLYSNSLKPANETIIIAMKKYKEKTKTDHILTYYNERKELLEKGIKEEDLCYYTKNSHGGVRIDKGNNEYSFSSRIPTEENCNRLPHSIKLFGIQLKTDIITGDTTGDGRFPATVLCSDNCLDVCRISKATGNNIIVNAKSFYQKGGGYEIFRHNDEGDLSRYFSIDNWTKKHLPELYVISKKTLDLQTDSKKIAPFLFTTKPSVSESNAGLDSFDKQQTKKAIQSEFNDNKNLNHPVANTHPTKKPIQLFCYLINLFSEPNSIILDTYSGSGTTCIASALINRKYIGCDMESEYCNIATARIEYWKKQIELQKNHSVVDIKKRDDNENILFKI